MASLRPHSGSEHRGTCLSTQSKEGDEGHCEFEPSQPVVILSVPGSRPPAHPAQTAQKSTKQTKTTTKSKLSEKEKAWKPGLESRLIQGFLRGPEERTKGRVVVLPRVRLGKVWSTLEPGPQRSYSFSSWENGSSHPHPTKSCGYQSWGRCVWGILCSLAYVVWLSSLLTLAIFFCKQHIKCCIS